ncbi:MAG: glucokinase, partial [Cyanobacteria bacterium J06648_11]
MGVSLASDVSVSLAGDIGGTKTLLRLSRSHPGKTKLEPLLEERYVSANFSDLVPIVRLFCQQAETQGLLQSGDLKTAC